MSSGATPQLLKVYMAQAPGSVGVDEFQLRKQTTLDRVWHWLTRRSVPVVGSWQHTLAKCMDATLYSVFVVTVTLLALFLVDVSVVSAHYTATLDTTVGAIIFACFLFFLLEILAAVCVQDDYFLSFFFLCDFVGTLSLIFDIPWISNPAGLNLSSSSAAVLRASRIARTGTRATRVLRLLRTMRMPALLRCCNRDEEEDEHDQAALDPKEDAAHRARREQAALAAQQIDTTVGSKLQLVVSKRVIFLVTLMIFVIPLLQVSTTDYSRPVGLTLTEAATRNNSDAFDTMVDQYLTSVGSSCIYVQVLDLARPSIVPDVSYIRPGSLVNVTSDTVLSWALFDNTSQAIQSSYYTLGMTCFTIVLFAGGSILFTQDAERMFFKPIERMIQKIKRLSAIMFELDATDADEVALDETLLIEAVVTRMSDMFNVRLDRDGVKRKTTMMKTASSRWRIHIEEEEVEPVDLSQPVKNKDLLLSHELEELASLPRCLESPTCMIYLSQYLRHAYCVETVLFLAEVRSFRLASERLAHHARQIYRLFIGDDAVNQVSVAWGVRRAISQNMKTQFAFLADLFEPAEEEVTAALSRDVFPRFLNSIYCLRLLKHMTLERRAQQRRQHQSLVAAATAMHQGDGTHEVAEEQLPAGGLIQLADMDEIKRAIGHEQQ